MERYSIKDTNQGFPGGYGLRLRFQCTGAPVQSLVGELRSCMLCSVAKRKKRTEKKQCQPTGKHWLLREKGKGNKGRWNDLEI